MAKIVYRAFEHGLIVFYGGIYLDQAIGEVEAGEVSDEVLSDYAAW
jgi:hypothetical protein